ncbi:hypothetical protein PTSG_06791 [Salpingoeca rosetta]|uniref:EF-hand domain-containing protein n=1 Tax=Salpingoeca rosetta (strain ATCC 50818 / BSB-021) TaxID=946362 RepID=F2UET6_SALR5|nr:uncharacterized protein PTSG_06791 [Salpingoeca rosetta]EGD75136.1 hypothetical protein PTSG_06791 [Salpingoeca rosetta]|eukprot:XP_004992189.1 hypothetical protein PTSG_06791 [Salpingoeca rosetta]
MVPCTINWTFSWCFDLRESETATMAMVSVVVVLVLVVVVLVVVVGDGVKADISKHMTELAAIAEEHLRSKHSMFDSNFDLKAAFKLHDYNDDDHLDMKEASFFYEDDFLTKKQLKEQLKAVFQTMDMDKDGLLSYKEFKRFYKNVIHNKPLMPELTDESPKHANKQQQKKRESTRTSSSSSSKEKKQGTRRH